jgi:hypothetical protein
MAIVVTIDQSSAHVDLEEGTPIWWRSSMDALAERLDKKLREWSPETAEQVRNQVVEIIELADQGLLDIVRSRQVEQEVLDLLDEPTTR